MSGRESGRGSPRHERPDEADDLRMHFARRLSTFEPDEARVIARVRERQYAAVSHQASIMEDRGLLVRLGFAAVAVGVLAVLLGWSSPDTEVTTVATAPPVLPVETSDVLPTTLPALTIDDRAVADSTAPVTASLPAAPTTVPPNVAPSVAPSSSATSSTADDRSDPSVATTVESGSVPTSEPVTTTTTSASASVSTTATVAQAVVPTSAKEPPASVQSRPPAPVESPTSTTSTTSAGPVNADPAVSAPVDQSSVVGDQARLSIPASDADGDDLTFSAEGLPPGLAIDPTTGSISGTMTAAGKYQVTVTVADDRGGRADVSLGWLVDSLRPGCDSEDSLRSKTGGKIRRSLRVINNGDEDIQVFWIDYNGRRDRYGTIEPGSSIDYRTLKHHVWMIASADDGRCLHLLKKVDEDHVVIID